jgi:nucleotide-binding universal stress UspA family protein
VDTTSATPLVVLHVAHEPAHKPGFYVRQGLSDSILPIAYLARRTLTDFMTKVRRQYPEIARLQNVQEEIISGLPETRIPELAKKIDAQLIICGCTGRSTLSKLCFGSVSDKVKRINDIPVRVVHSDRAGGLDAQRVTDNGILCEQTGSTEGVRNQIGLG